MRGTAGNDGTRGRGEGACQRVEYRLGKASAALPINTPYFKGVIYLFFQPDDGLGSNGQPGAVAIFINQNRSSANERLMWKWERVDSIWGKTSAPFPAGRGRSPKGHGERKLGKGGADRRVSDPMGSGLMDHPGGRMRTWTGFQRP